MSADVTTGSGTGGGKWTNIVLAVAGCVLFGALVLWLMCYNCGKRCRTSGQQEVGARRVLVGSPIRSSRASSSDGHSTSRECRVIQLSSPTPFSEKGSTPSPPLSSSPPTDATPTGACQADRTGADACMDSINSAFGGDMTSKSDVKLSHVIGRGGFATVWLASQQGAPIAAKLLTHHKARKAIKREAGLLRRLRHPCICTFFGVTDIGDTPTILLEYLAGGTLEEYLQLIPGRGAPPPGANAADNQYLADDCLAAARQSPIQFSVEDEPEEQLDRQEACAVPPPGNCSHTRAPSRTNKLLCFGQQVASGLSFLHSNRVIHRDVKASNVLLDGAQGVAKLSDFGISHHMPSHMPHNSDASVAENSPLDAGLSSMTGMGTLRYAAPESIVPGEEGRRSRPTVEQLTSRDVYSFGLLLFELTHEQRAFEELPPIAALASSIGGRRPTIDLPADLDACAQLISECWQMDSQSRPRMEEVCAKLSSPLAKLSQTQLTL